MVAKQGAKIKAHARKVIHHGQKAVVTAKVKTTAGQKGVGSIVAKAKGAQAKTKALKNGKVRFVFKGLSLGKNSDASCASSATGTPTRPRSRSA